MRVVSGESDGVVDGGDGDGYGYDSYDNGYDDYDNDDAGTL